MRMLALSLLVAGSLAAAGGALAQDGGAECQAGVVRGCGAGPSGGPYGAPGSGRYVAPAYPPLGAPGYGAYAPYAYERSYTRPAPPHQRPTRRDRDGDGVRNNRDRYPDDPSRS